MVNNVNNKGSSVENKSKFVYTEEQLMARLKFFIGVCLALTLTGIVFVVLYSFIFVTQPIYALSPVNQKFFELIVPIATFLTGTLSGIMLTSSKKEDRPVMISPPILTNKVVDSTKKAPVSTPTATTTSNVVADVKPVEETKSPEQEVVVGFAGRMAPPQAEHPEI